MKIKILIEKECPRCSHKRGMATSETCICDSGWIKSDISLDEFVEMIMLKLGKLI